ncbi:MAG: PAS domain S-box protein [Candidatus Eisenbacteria bacterium]
MHSRSSLATDGHEGTTRPGWAPTLHSLSASDPSQLTFTVSEVPDWQLAEHRYHILLSTIAERVWRFSLTPSLPLDHEPEVLATAILRRARLVECNPAWTHLSGEEAADDISGLWLPDVLMGTYPEQMELLSTFARSGFRLVDVRTTEWDRTGRPIGVLTNLVGIVEDGRLSGLWGAQRPLTPETTLDRTPHVFSRGLSDQVTIADRDGRILFESPGMECALGLAEGERRGQDLFAHVAPEDIAGLRDAFDQVLLTPGATGPLTVVRARHRDGDWRSHAIVVSHLDGLPGPPLLALSVLDVTPRAHSETSGLEDLAPGEPAASGSAAEPLHELVCELNDILTVIAGHAQLGLQNAAPRSRMARNLKSIEQAAARASGVVRSLAESRADSPARRVVGPPAVRLVGPGQVRTTCTTKLASAPA